MRGRNFRSERFITSGRVGVQITVDDKFMGTTQSTLKLTAAVYDDNQKTRV